MKHMKSYTRTGWVGAGLFVAFFALCMLWGLLLTEPALKELHQNILKIAYPGFSFSAVGMLIGLIESVAYGFFFGVLFVWLCKVCCVSNNDT